MQVMRWPLRIAAAVAAVAMCAGAGAGPGAGAGAAASSAAGRVWSGPSLFSARSDGPAWPALMTAQRAALSPLAGVWPSMAAEQKHRWLVLADRYPALPASEQSRIQARMTEWAKLTPQQRGQMRVRFKEAQQLSPLERQARWDAYQALPPEQRKALAERASAAGSAAHLASRPAVGLHGHPEAPVHAPERPRLQPVAPAIVKAGPGATTTLITRTGVPPAHQRPGMPRIAVSADEVSTATLLPRRGAQSPGSVSTAAQASAHASAPATSGRH